MGIETEFDDVPITEAKIPHLLKYMGSKREIIDYVKESIKFLNIEGGWLCDLFSGTGVVSGAMKGEYNIHSNDVQSYSSVLSRTYLSTFKGNIKSTILTQIKKQVEELILQFNKKYPRDFNYDEIKDFKSFQLQEKQQQGLINADFQIGFHLFTKYYSGTYWSYEQCLWIDSIRAVAEKYKGKDEYYAIISSLIFAMSYTSQSTGHYAQYRDATKDNMIDILGYRKKEIWSYFERKFIELITTMNGSVREYKITTLDYIDCLRILEESSIIYADPPYQSVHYSRFYHALETLVRYDYPKVLYKGRYREDRHQSPFCKKTTVKDSFSLLFEATNFKKSHLVLSYSDTGMISLKEIISLAKNKFSNQYKIDILEKDHIHSKMGRSDIRNQDVVEYSIIFKRK